MKIQTHENFITTIVLYRGFKEYLLAQLGGAISTTLTSFFKSTPSVGLKIQIHKNFITTIVLYRGFQEYLLAQLGGVTHTTLTSIF